MVEEAKLPSLSSPLLSLAPCSMLVLIMLALLLLGPDPNADFGSSSIIQERTIDHCNSCQSGMVAFYWMTSTLLLFRDEL